MITNKGRFLAFIRYGTVKSKKKNNKSVREDGVYVTFSKKISTIKMLVLSILEVISPVLQFFILDYMTQ